MRSKFYKLLNKEAVECATHEEFTRWLKTYHPDMGIVGMTEIEGVVIATTFLPVVIMGRDINALGEPCPFRSRLFIAGEFGQPLNGSLAMPFYSQDKAPVPEYHMKSWEDAKYIHDILVKRMLFQFANAKNASDGILRQFGVEIGE